MKIILDYWGYWETFEIKWANQKQMIEIRRKVIMSFTNKKRNLEVISKKIKNAKNVIDLF